MTGGYGWKARIGQLYPAGGLADGEPQAMAPEGVLFVTTRIGFARVGLKHARGLVEDLETPARLLKDAAVQMVLFNCTSASMDVGPEAINRRIEAATGVPSTTTIEGVMAALRATKAERIGLLTPYTPDVIEAETRFLAGHGISVAMNGGDPCATPVEQGLLPPARWIEWAKPFAGKKLDALLVRSRITTNTRCRMLTMTPLQHRKRSSAVKSVRDLLEQRVGLSPRGYWGL